MTLLQLKYISTVAKYGSFCKAAQALYVSQPGISKMVCALEEELGITIFVRSAAGITLTAEGRELLNMGERLLKDAEHISRHFTQDMGKTHETLSVSSQHYCFVIDALMDYQRASKKDDYTYKLLVGQGPEVIQQVSDKTTELGVLFISDRSRKHMNRVFGDNHLEFHPLVNSKPYVFIHETHPLAKKSVLTLEELQGFAAARGCRCMGNIRLRPATFSWCYTRYPRFRPFCNAICPHWNDRAAQALKIS